MPVLIEAVCLGGKTKGRGGARGQAWSSMMDCNAPH
jgi:hypothetical protein